MAAFRFSCPSCQGLLQGEDSMRGKQVRCPTCQHVFPVPASEAPGGPVWYIARNKAKDGPYSTAQLRQLAASGQVRAQDMVLREGHGKWLPASSIKGLLPASTTPPVAIFVGPTPPGGSKAPMAFPINGGRTSSNAEFADVIGSRSVRRRKLWPWLVGGGTAATLLIAVGVLALTGFFSRKEDGQPTGSKLDLSYIASHFNGAIVMHPRRALQAEVLKKALPEKFLEDLVKEAQGDPRKVEQVILLFEPPQAMGQAPPKGQAVLKSRSNVALPVPVGEDLPASRLARESGLAPEIRLVQYRPERAPADTGAAAGGTARGSSRDKAIAWLRANNAFGPKHRMVDQLAKPLSEVDGGKAFFLRLGTKLVKSHKPTLLAGRNGAFQAFEVPPELAGKWIPELLTELKTTAALDEVVNAIPSVMLDRLKFDNASGLDFRSKLTGSVAYRKLNLLEGSLGLRLTYMAGEYTHTGYYRFEGGLPGDAGTADFSFPPLKVDASRPSDPVPVFVELCSFPDGGRRGKVVVRSNSIAALIHVAQRTGAAAEEEQQPPPGQEELPFGFGGIIRFIGPEDKQALLAKIIEKADTKDFEGKKYYATKEQKFHGEPLALYVGDEHTLVFGPESTLHKMLSAQGAKSPLIDRLRNIDLNTDLVGVVMLEPYARMAAPVLEQAAPMIPPDLADVKKLPNLMKAASFTLDLTGGTLLTITLDTENADAAGTVEKLVKSGLNYAKPLYGLGRPQLSKQVPPKVPPEAWRVFLAIADQMTKEDGIDIARHENQVVMSLKRPDNLVPDSATPAPKTKAGQ